MYVSAVKGISKPQRMYAKHVVYSYQVVMIVPILRPAKDAILPISSKVTNVSLAHLLY